MLHSPTGAIHPSAQSLLRTRRVSAAGFRTAILVTPGSRQPVRMVAHEAEALRQGIEPDHRHHQLPQGRRRSGRGRPGRHRARREIFTSKKVMPRPSRGPAPVRAPRIGRPRRADGQLCRDGGAPDRLRHAARPARRASAGGRAMTLHARAAFRSPPISGSAAFSTGCGRSPARTARSTGARGRGDGRLSRCRFTTWTSPTITARRGSDRGFPRQFAVAMARALSGSRPSRNGCPLRA